MGLRDKLKDKVRAVVDRFSGEHAEHAPKGEEIKPYERNLEPDDDAKVVMAKLNRPKGR